MLRIPRWQIPLHTGVLPVHFSTSPSSDLTSPMQFSKCLHMHDPREPHLTALKRILRYLRGTVNFSLLLHRRSASTELVVYTDADWVGCPDTRRSTSGYAAFLGGNLVSWSSKRQPVVSRSNAEAEYHVVANGVANGVAKASLPSSIALSHGAHWSTATTLVRCTSPPTRFNTRGPSMWRSIYTSSEIGSSSAMFGSSTS